MGEGVDLVDLSLDRVEAEIGVFFAESAARASAMSAQYADLWGTIAHATRGGKLLRPRLLLETVNAYREDAGTSWPPEPFTSAEEFARGAVAVALAIELLHAALLVHDDVIDKDVVRRGKPNIAGTYSARSVSHACCRDEALHHGASVAIIAGDMVLTAVFRVLRRGLPPGRLRDSVQDLLDDAIFATGAGELSDVLLSDVRRPLPPLPPHELDGEAGLEETARLKTAVYSVELPLLAGAHLANAPEAGMVALRRFAHHLGTAYQLVDDLIGVFGDARVTGKSTTGDLQQGKHTLLIEFARTRPGWSEVSHLHGHADLTPADAEALRGFLSASGARTHLEGLVHHHTRAAVATLDDSRIPAALRRHLEGVVGLATERSR